MNFTSRFWNLFRTIYSHPYNQKRPLFALYRLLRWQIDKRLRRGPIVYRMWKDRLAICYPDSEQTMWLVYNYVMDWEEFNLIADSLRADSIVFDVGANIGSYMLWMSRFVGPAGKIICFEPDAVNFERCSDLIRMNHLEKNVKVERTALSERAGRMLFSQGKDRMNHLLPPGVAPTGAVSVPTVTLDEYCQRHHIEKIDYLKMDVEGAELFVLRGARGLLERRAIKLIQFELNTQIEQFGLKASELTELLRQQGFTICRYDVEKKMLKPCAHDDYRENMFAAL